MRILGEWGPFDAAYIHASLICESLGVKSDITVLIDSGASRTSILDRDTDRLDIDYKKLRKFTPGNTGIGGSLLRDSLEMLLFKIAQPFNPFEALDRIPIKSLIGSP